MTQRGRWSFRGGLWEGGYVIIADIHVVVVSKTNKHVPAVGTLCIRLMISSRVICLCPAHLKKFFQARQGWFAIIQCLEKKSSAA